MIAGTDNLMNVPVEATAFLGAVAAFVVLLLVFFLYLNKKWCFYGIGGLSCCEEVLGGVQNTRARDLGKAYSYSEPESSSDSDEDVMRRLHQSTILHSSPTDSLPGPSSSATDLPFYHHHQHATVVTSVPQPSSHDVRSRGGDLVSLAEKGKATGGSSNSSSCSTTSGEHERHRKLLATTQCSVEQRPDNNNQDCIIVQEQQLLYDVTDLQSGFSDQESQLISKCGHLEVAFAYDAPTRKMTVRILQARDIPTKDRGGSQNSQVRLLLLPSKKQKHKTKIRQGDNPQYMESFLLHRVNPEDVHSMGVRVRLYGCERMRRERMIGECVVGFNCINLELETTMWLVLEPRANMALNSSASDLLSLARSDSTGSTHSMQHGGVPELLLGLAYNGTTGRLAVEVVKGSHFSRNLALARAPDTYVKLCLVSSTGQEMARSKTSIRRGQPNPLFKETFMFQVALFQLPDVTLMMSVFSKRSMKRKEMIGWFSLGMNSSGEEEVAHWNDMREVRGEQICRWHVLVEC